MKTLFVGLAVTAIACSPATQTPPECPQTAPSAAPVAGAAGAPTGTAGAPAAGTAGAPLAESPPADNGLNELAAMTFACPKAALDAAASAAAKVPTEGAYQFAYFGTVSDSHNAMYEVHFKSNYQSEPLLKYCVAIYCQQGWDPKTTQPVVMLLNDTRTAPGANGAAMAKGAKAAELHCGHKSMHAGAQRKTSTAPEPPAP
jgi:hypothetical protein